MAYVLEIRSAIGPAASEETLAGMRIMDTMRPRRVGERAPNRCSNSGIRVIGPIDPVSNIIDTFTCSYFIGYNPQALALQHCEIRTVIMRDSPENKSAQRNKCCASHIHRQMIK